MSVQQARALVTVRRWQDAERALASALGDPAAGAEPWCLLARCRLGMRDYCAARDAAQRALAIDPQSEWAHRLLAMALMNQAPATARLFRGRTPTPAQRQAVDVARRSVALAPNLDLALYTLTVAQVRARQLHPGARDTATTNLTRNPHSSLAFSGACLVSLAQERWGEVETMARQGLAIDPEDGDLLRYLGRALDAQGRSREAGVALAASARLDPTSSRARESLGQLGSGTVFGDLGWGARIAIILLVVAFSGILLPALAIRLAVNWVRHARARAGLPPELRRIAVRERRRARAPLLGVLAGVLVAFAVVAALTTAWGAAAIWCAAALAPGSLWWRWRARA